MKSYTTLRNLYGSYSKNTATANLTLGDQWINDSYKRICGLVDWPFLYVARTLTTTASTQAINLPYDTSRVRSVTVTVSTRVYTPKEITSRVDWDRLNQVTVTSDSVTHYYVYNNQLLLFPIPATSSNTVTFHSKRSIKDLSIADYTTGTITTIANGATTVTGSGTTWATSMAGRYIRITESDTALKGDGVWYEISSVTSATVLELTRKYGGTAIAAGSAAYTIGQMPLLPENYQELPVFEAASQYWGLNPDIGKRQDYYGKKFKEGLEELKATHSSTSTGVVIDDGDDAPMINPNLYITL